MKFGAHRTSHLTSISHLTSKPTHDALRHPARWRQWEDARALYRRKRGLVAASKRMQAEGMMSRAAASELRVPHPRPKN